MCVCVCVCVCVSVCVCVLHRTPAARSITSHLTNYSSKTNKTSWRRKDELIGDIPSWILGHECASVGRPPGT